MNASKTTSALTLPPGLDTTTQRGREQLLALRDQAEEDRNLPVALQLDDLLENHAVLTGDDRVTCFTCQDWADHFHNLYTGERIRDLVDQAAAAPAP